MLIIAVKTPREYNIEKMEFPPEYFDLIQALIFGRLCRALGFIRTQSQFTLEMSVSTRVWGYKMQDRITIRGTLTKGNRHCAPVFIGCQGKVCHSTTTRGADFTGPGRAL